jgi:hypothetical protein
MASNAAEQKFIFDETDDTDSIYENVDDVRKSLKHPDDDCDNDPRDVQRRFRQNSRGSSSAEDSSGSFNAERPPKTPSKLRISKPEVCRSSSGSVKYSYDEVTVNFGKPVIASPKRPTLQVSILQNVFLSPTFFDIYA